MGYNKIKCIAIIPIRGRDIIVNDNEILKIGDKNVLQYTIEVALECHNIDKVYVTTDNEIIREEAVKLGAEAPFLRPLELSDKNIKLPKVLNYTLVELKEKCNVEPENVVLLEVAHPFRDAKLVDDMIMTLNKEKLDSIFTVVETRENYWKFDENNNIRRVYESHIYDNRKEKSPLYKEVLGVSCVTKTKFIDDNNILGENVGVVPVRDENSKIDLLNKADRLFARYINLLDETK